MQHTLDLNEYSGQTLLLTLQDEAKTRIHITTPTVALTKELRAKLPQLNEVFKGTGQETTRSIYEFAAKLINCNQDFVRITGEELATKYRVTIEGLIIFFNAYVEFIDAIQNAKN